MILMSCENVQEKSEQFKQNLPLQSQTENLKMPNALPTMRKHITKGLVIPTKEV